MNAESRVLVLTICSNTKDEGGFDTYDAKHGIVSQLHPESAAQLLAARRQVHHLVKSPSLVVRHDKVLSELRLNKELVLGPDFDPKDPEPRGHYLPAAQRYTGRFFSRLGGDPLTTLTNTPHHVLVISGLYGLLRPEEHTSSATAVMYRIIQTSLQRGWPGGALVNALVSYIERHHITHVFELMGDDNYKHLIAWNQLQDRTGATVLHAVGENYSGPALLLSLGRLMTQLLPLPEEELLAIKSGDTRDLPGETITFRDHPSLAVRIKQTNTYAEMGDHKRALSVLSDARPENAGERARVQERRIEILLAAGYHTEVIHETSDLSIPPYWRGMRGVALARLHRGVEANEALARAWTEGDRHAVVTREVARRAMVQGDEKLASEAYRLLLGHKSPKLDAHDHHHIAVLAEMGALEADELSHADAFASDVDERDLIELPYASDLLLWRVERSRQSRDGKHLLRDYADLLDCVCLRNDVGGIGLFLGRLNHDREHRLLTREQQFDILEGLEPFTSDIPALAKILSAEYVAIGYAEFDLALRDDRAMPPYISGLLRALDIRDASSLRDLEEYFRAEQKKLLAQNQSTPTTLVATEATVALTGIRLALVGGHQQARHHVLETLRKKHGLTHPIEVAPTSEGRQDTRAVSDKIRNCDLVIVIKNYIGHDLSGIVGDLERRGQLSGRAYWLDTRGQNGVVREILQVVASQCGR